MYDTMAKNCASQWVPILRSAGLVSEWIEKMEKCWDNLHSSKRGRGIHKPSVSGQGVVTSATDSVGMEGLGTDIGGDDEDGSSDDEEEGLDDDDNWYDSDWEEGDE